MEESNRYCISYRIYWSRWSDRITGHTFAVSGSPLDDYMIDTIIKNDIKLRYGENIIYESYELIKIFEFKGDKIYAS